MLKSNEDNPTNSNCIMSINTKLKFIISSRDPRGALSGLLRYSAADYFAE